MAELEMKDLERANILNDKLSQIYVFFQTLILILKESKGYELAQWNPRKRECGQIFNE